jgi:hypothetical protein
MSEAQDSRQVCYADAGPAEPAPPRNLRRGSEAGDASCGYFGIDPGADRDGHTLLSPPPAPEGRRSLFRR